MTLRLRAPFGGTILLGVLLIPILLGLIEGFFRLAPRTDRFLAPPTRGGNEDSIGIKIDLLDQLASKNQIDCIFIGSSMTVYGIEPEAVASGYKAEIGRDITCFNFGVLGAGTGDLALWADVLAKRYHPTILILGTSARDFSLNAGSDRLGLDIDFPWAHYQLGEFSLEGWLTDWSLAYRYYQTYRLWTSSNFSARIESFHSMESQMTRFGFLPRSESLNVRTPVAQLERGYWAKKEVENYVISDHDQMGLEHIVSLRHVPAVTVIVLEMPLPTTYLNFFDDPEKDYGTYLRLIELETHTHGVLLIYAPPPESFPDDGWYDYAHLNSKGAAVYSTWLGRQLAITSSETPAIAPTH